MSGKFFILSFKNAIKGLHVAVFILGFLCLLNFFKNGVKLPEYFILIQLSLFLILWWTSTIKLYPAVPYQRAGIEIHYYRAKLCGELFLVLALLFYLIRKNIFMLSFFMAVTIFLVFANIVLLYFFSLDKDTRNPNMLSGYFEH